MGKKEEEEEDKPKKIGTARASYTAIARLYYTSSMVHTTIAVEEKSSYI